MQPLKLPTGLPGLAAARCARGMSRAAVAQALGLREADVAALEAGDHDAPPLLGMAIARLLGTSLLHLRRAAPPGPEPRRGDPAPLWLGFFPNHAHTGSKQLELEAFYNRF